jgi:hypothetical protein
MFFISITIILNYLITGSVLLIFHVIIDGGMLFWHPTSYLATLGMLVANKKHYNSK